MFELLEMNSVILVLVIILALIVFVILSIFVAHYGRRYSLPEEVTKGIKSDTPFPSISSNNSKHHHHHRSHSRQNISKNSSTFDLMNNEPYFPSDFVIDDSTFIVKKEFIPKSVDELPVKKNQILSVKEIYEDGWCMAISVSSGEMGVVPFQCLYKYTDLLKKKKSYQKQKQMQVQKQKQKKIQKQSSKGPSISPVPPLPQSSPYSQSYSTTPPSPHYGQLYKTSTPPSPNFVQAFPAPPSPHFAQAFPTPPSPHFGQTFATPPK
ncbi:hypothetical protein PIROE2DRAFT_9560, partial [Piromyces sp. E2]